ncbi:hypothetical protein BDV06DRAFT_172406 [Aspergillus oleicola]
MAPLEHGERLSRVKTFYDSFRNYPKKFRGIFQKMIGRRSRGKNLPHNPVSTTVGEIHPGDKASTRPHERVPHHEGLIAENFETMEDHKHIGKGEMRPGDTAPSIPHGGVFHRQGSVVENVKSMESPKQSLAVPAPLHHSYSNRTLSDFAASPYTTIFEPSSSNSSLESLPVDYGKRNKLPIRVQRPNSNPTNAVRMIALLDTGCETVAPLMTYRHFQRLNIHDLDPFEGEIEGLYGARGEARGIARGLKWYFEEGYKTYTSDFIIVDLDQYDVLINNNTIWKYDLLETGSDYKEHLKRSARKKQQAALIFKT